MALTVIIPSRRSANLLACLAAIRAHDPDCGRILVVDDGAREGVERRRLDLGVEWIEAGDRPFVFARAVNRGILAAGDDDVILLNDDAELLTPRGFTQLGARASEEGWWVLAAGVRGDVGNRAQAWRGRRDPIELEQVCFICAFIARDAIRCVGLLDERFVAYGFDDDDYCRRVRMAGGRVGVWDGCVVRHGHLPHTYSRTRDQFMLAQRLFRDKWEREMANACAKAQCQ
jgi:GT2 family glycosyltransferase